MLKNWDNLPKLYFTSFMWDKQGWNKRKILLVCKRINHLHFVAKIYPEINFEGKIHWNIFFNRNIYFFDCTWGKPNPKGYGGIYPELSKIFLFKIHLDIFFVINLSQHCNCNLHWCTCQKTINHLQKSAIRTNWNGQLKQKLKLELKSLH